MIAVSPGRISAAIASCAAANSLSKARTMTRRKRIGCVMSGSLMPRR